MIWLILAQTDAEASDADFWIDLIILSIYLLVGLAFAIGIVWALISRYRREKRQDKFENRDN